MPNLVLDRASAADDGAIRALLRRMPMEGDIQLSFEREPSLALSESIEGDRHYTFVLRDAAGEVRAVCTRAVRPLWFNGRAARGGYLGMLRCEVPLRGSLRGLRDGFAACAATRQSDELPFDFTSIMADNLRARRLLEKELPGMPRYEPVANFTTMLIRPERRSVADSSVQLVKARADDAERIAAFLQHEYARFQFAPIWSAADLTSDTTRDLRVEDFVLAMKDADIVGCAALWEQSRFRQTVVRGYSPRLGRLRPLLNFGSRLRSRPLLPSVGAPVRFAAISHFAVSGDHAAVAHALISGLSREAASLPVDYLVLGLGEQHPLRAIMEKKLSSRVLRSIIYTVHYDETTDDALDGRVVQPEVATL